GRADDRELLERRRREAMAAIKLRSLIDCHAKIDRHGAPVQQAVGQLPSDFPFCIAGTEIATGGLQGVDDDLAQGAQTGLLVRAGLPTEPGNPIADKLGVRQYAVGSETPILLDIGHQLVATPLPGPLLQLESQLVDLLVEQARRINVAGNDPAVLAVAKQNGT